MSTYRRVQKHGTRNKRNRSRNKTGGGLSDALTVIEQLNREIGRKCPGMYLQLDTMLNIRGDIHRYTNASRSITRSQSTTLLLCLNKNGNCVSSIELVTFPNQEYIIINSATLPEEQGNKYNKLLRTALMLIGRYIPGITQIYSAATNPISAWLLISNYDVVFEDNNSGFFEYTTNHDIEPGRITQRQVRDFYESYDEDSYRMPLISLNVPLTVSNIVRAESYLRELLSNSKSSIRC